MSRNAIWMWREIILPKNPAAVALGKLGGSVKSAAKTAAAKRNIAKRWEMIKARHKLNNLAAKATAEVMGEKTPKFIKRKQTSTKGVK